MNLKIFSIITGVLIGVIVILGGTYYYLFEYSKPKPSYNTYNSNIAQTYNENVISNQQNQNSNYANNLIENTQNSYSTNTNSINTTSDNADTNTTQNILDHNQSSIPASNNNTIENKVAQNIQKNQRSQETKNNKKETSKSDNKKQEPISKQEKPNHNKNTQKNTQVKKLSVAQEYLSRGKDSRLEPQLSTENMKVYVLDGKFLSDYRINLLKEMLASIENASKDYNLSVFIQMLPKNEMRLTIYNKDIIFSEMRKAYKYISMEKIKPYLNNLKELNSHVAREEKLEKLALQIKKDGKGSDFAKHIKSLRTGLNTAQYFFPFCEVIEITSINP